MLRDLSHLANLAGVDSNGPPPEPQAMMEDYGAAPVSSPAEAPGRSFSAGTAEAAVLNSGGGGGCKTVRFQSGRPKKLSNINEDSR